MNLNQVNTQLQDYDLTLNLGRNVFRSHKRSTLNKRTKKKMKKFHITLPNQKIVGKLNVNFKKFLEKDIL